MISKGLGSTQLLDAADDIRYLLNRGYPRKPALELVGNRHQLTSNQRHLLHRGVFSEEDSRRRREAKVTIKRLQGQDLAIDGHNVLITIEAGLSRRPLIHADDGFIRDISGLSGHFRKTSKTEEAIRLMLDVLKKIEPRRVLFLFDAPISKSGILAREVRNLLVKEGLPGDAEAVKVPEDVLVGFPGIVATSDTAIIDHTRRVVDLAGYIIQTRIRPHSLARWSRRRNRIGKRRES